MTVDYANQISNLIKELAPASSLNIGNKFQATSIDIDLEKVYLEFEEENYIYLASLINDSSNPNTEFTISGFRLKNRIVSFSAHPSDSTFKYAFLVEFEKPHKLKTDQTITLKGFTNTSYSIEYKVLRSIDSYFVILYPKTAVAITDLTSGLGYLPVAYTSGLNGIKILSDEGDNTLSYEIDEDEYLVVTDVEDIDETYDIFLHDYNENIKVVALETFMSNLTDASTRDYLIVDTTSLSGTQNRSRSNRQDSSYNAYGRVGFFEKNYTINLHYLLERNTDDANNQTTSSSDVIKKQVETHDSLISILRESLEDDSNNKIFTSITILSDGPPIIVPEGRVRITYTLGFSVFYNSDILMEKDDKNSYRINSLKINNDVVNFS
jgi:hypothetical protein